MQQFRSSKAKHVQKLVEERILNMIIGEIGSVRSSGAGKKFSPSKKSKSNSESKRGEVFELDTAIGSIDKTGSEEFQTEANETERLSDTDNDGEVESENSNDTGRDGDKTREHFRLLYRQGDLDDMVVDVDLSLLHSGLSGNGGSGLGGGSGGSGNFQLVVDTQQSSDRNKHTAMEAIKDLKIIFENIRQDGETRPSSSTSLIPSRQAGMANLGAIDGMNSGRFDSSTSGANSTNSRRMRVRELRPILEEDETNKLQSDDKIVSEALKKAESEGIVFIDEIDKICRSKDHSRHTGADASRYV